MRKRLLLLAAFAFAGNLVSQTPEAYEFKEVKRLAASPVKDQQNTGTCWAFSTTSFIESELQRMGHGAADLSEMFIVRHIYRQKCENYVRRQGTAQLSQGGLGHDLINAIRAHGVAPESVYPGRPDPSQPLDHSALEVRLQKMCDEFVDLGKRGALPDNWLEEIDATLDAALGESPKKFLLAERQWSTPIFYRDYLGINPDDYVSITSFTHHPFWTKFILEIPDNFANGEFYNMPISDLMRCIRSALEQGYSIEWDADVSNAGFSAKNGLAIVPATDWKDKSVAQQVQTFKAWEPEKTISQEYRQQLFDRQETVDDHLMHITGMVDEKHNGMFYVVKNSWGEISDLKGYLYVSEAYMRLNTISILLHKNAIPKDIRQKMGLEDGKTIIPTARMGPQTDPKKQPEMRRSIVVPKAKSTPPAQPKIEPASKDKN